MVQLREFEREIPPRYKDASVANFRWGKKQNELINLWIKHCQCFLIFMGIPGCGKTYSAIALGKYLVGKNNIWDLEFANYGQWLQYIRSQYDVNKSDFYPRNILKSTSLLILDDMGATKNSVWEQEILLDLIDYRYSNEKSTIITTNLNFEEMLENKIDPRVISRLEATENLVIQDWENDWRKKNDL